MGEVAASYVSIYPKITADFSRQIETQIRKQTTGAFGPVEKQSDESGKKAGRKFGDSFRSVAAPILTVAAVGAIAKLVDKAVGDFSELEDATAAAGVVFGDSMQTIIDQSESAASTMGMSKKQVIDAANTFGTFGKSAGLAGDDLAGFSVEMTKTAADLASFKGGSPEDAILAVGSALRGEQEPIRRYGVLLDDATLRQQALKMGLISTVKEGLTPQQKVLAAQAEILKQTTDAQGDFARTSDSTANTAKILAAESANLSAELGQKLAPAIVAAQKAGIGFLRFVTDNQAAILPLVGTLGTLALAVGGFVAAAKGIEAVKSARDTIRGLGDAFQQMGTKAKIATVSAGAIGIALTAAATIYGLFAQENANAQNRVDDFTAALQASNGALDENVQLTARKMLEDAGALQAAQQLGLSLDVVTQAAIGNADAMELVSIRLAAADSRWTSAASATTDEAKAAGALRTALGGTSTALSEATTKHERLYGATGRSTTATEDSTAAATTGADAMETYATQIDKVYKAQLALSGGQIALESAIDAASESVKENGKTLDITTEKGRANRSALDDIAAAGLGLVQNLKDTGASTDDVASAMDHSRASFIKAARQMGLSETAAKKLADKLGLIKSKDVTVKVNIKVKQTGEVDASSGLKVYVTGNGQKLMARGGPVFGGVPGRDSVSALLMPDEHVWTVQEVRAAGGHAAMMRARAAARSGLLRFAEGGPVAPTAAGSGVLGGGPSADAIGAAVASALMARGVSMLTIADGVSALQSEAYGRV